MLVPLVFRVFRTHYSHGHTVWGFRRGLHVRSRNLRGRRRWYACLVMLGKFSVWDIEEKNREEHNILHLVYVALALAEGGEWLRRSVSDRQFYLKSNAF